MKSVFSFTASNALITFYIVLSFLLLKQENFVTLCNESVSKDKKNDLEIIQKSTSFLTTWASNNYKLQLSCNDLA